MSVNLGGIASGAGEKGADEPVGLGEGVAAASDVGKVEGRVPARVADGCWAGAMPWQIRKTRAEAIVFTTSYWAVLLFCRFGRDGKNGLEASFYGRTTAGQTRLRRAAFAQRGAGSKPPTARRGSPFLQSGRRKRLPYNLLAQSLIEHEAATIFNFDLPEVSMLGIQEKRFFQRNNHTRHNKNSGPAGLDPFVPNIF
jgi:hypothetical protein